MNLNNLSFDKENQGKQKHALQTQLSKSIHIFFKTLKAVQMLTIVRSNIDLYE